MLQTRGQATPRNVREQYPKQEGRRLLEDSEACPYKHLRTVAYFQPTFTGSAFTPVTA